MDINRMKLMCWSNGELQIFDEGKWRNYRSHPLRVADLGIPGASKGYPTMQRLLGLGYSMVGAEALSKVGATAND